MPRRPFLVEPRDLQSLLVVALHYELAAACFVGWRSLARWQIALAVAALCLTAFLVSVIVHNTVHHPIFHRRGLNKIFQAVLSVGQGHPVTAFVPGHNFSHHLHTNTPKDVMRSTRMRFRWNLLNQLLFFFFVIPDILDAERRWAKRMRVENPAWFRQWLVETLLVYAVKLGALAVDWRAGLLFVWIPHLYGNWGIVGTNVWQHDGTITGSKYDHSRSMTGRVLNAFLFNNGFHAAHHMNPGLHWSRLAAWHDEHVAPFAHPGLQQRSLLLYLIRANLWPGRRRDLDGNALLRPARAPSEDWLADVDFARRAPGSLGADPLAIRE